MDRKIGLLFKNLCCSKCKHDFDDDSVEIIRQESQLVVIKLVCQNCQKSFGIAFLGLSNIDSKNPEDFVLNKNEDLPAITADDVIDAHEFIKNLDEHWQKYLPQ